MKSFKYIIIFVALVALAIPDSRADECTGLSDTIFWDNGEPKEVADWQNGFIIGERKLYSKRGELLERHEFRSGNKKGYLYTYFSDTIVSSVVPVVQKYVDGEYAIFIQADEMVTGYFEDSENKSYDFSVAEPLRLSETTYKRYNNFYNDPQLYRTRSIEGLNAQIAYYNKYGEMISEEVVVNGETSGLTKTYYPNGQVKSEGHQKQVRSSVYRVGDWTFYYKDGVIEKKLEYYAGQDSRKYIEWGTLINIGEYFYPDGEPSMVIHYPEVDDYYHRIDTLEVYYENHQMKMLYEPDDHISMISADEVTEYQYSAKHTEWYKNGNLKAIGYYVNIPRTQPSEDDLVLDKLLAEEDYRRVGTWYFFNEDGSMSRVIDYLLASGKIDEEWKDRKVEKESEKYLSNPDNYDFEFIISW